jgi:hypothetical protein
MISYLLLKKAVVLKTFLRRKRYPALWGINGLDSIPNPNPQDLDKERDTGSQLTSPEEDQQRAAKKADAQRWAGLDVSPSATLLVFVGRWSTQKGIDLIADLAPKLFETYKNVQFICVGPIIDLHGKLAALKLDQLARRYPGRLFSKPEFTAVPKYVFESCDFVLIPSRDEPFGLVAVEFGRSGALGIGSYVGGLGSMPGWWYPIESSETEHLLDQFWRAIELALASPWMTRAAMRKQAQKQRFPVKEWLKKLDAMYCHILKNCKDVKEKAEPVILKSAIDKNDFLQMSGRSNLVRSGLPEIEDPSGIRKLTSLLKLKEKKSIPTLDTSSSNFTKESSKDISSETLDVDVSQFRDIPWSPLSAGSVRVKRHFANFSSSSSDILNGVHHVDSRVDISGIAPPQFSTYLDSIPLVSLPEIEQWKEYHVRSFEQFDDPDGVVSKEFEGHLSKLDVKNSQETLCIDKVLKKV